MYSEATQERLEATLLDLADVTTRLITGQPVTPPNATSIPFLKRVLRIGDRSAGGLQQQFYELRGEVDTVVQSMNLLKEQGRQEDLPSLQKQHARCS